VTTYRLALPLRHFLISRLNDDSVSLTGLDASLWTFVENAGGYFIFDAKLAQGITYHFNFVGNKGTWAQTGNFVAFTASRQTGPNVDIVCRVDSDS